MNAYSLATRDPCWSSLRTWWFWLLTCRRVKYNALIYSVVFYWRTARPDRWLIDVPILRSSMTFGNDIDIFVPIREPKLSYRKSFWNDWANPRTEERAILFFNQRRIVVGLEAPRMKMLPSLIDVFLKGKWWIIIIIIVLVVAIY